VSAAGRALGVTPADERQEDLVDDLGQDVVGHGRDAAGHVLVAQQCRRRGGDPDARTAGRLADGLRALTARGKPAAVTEFGCPAYRGAGDSGQGDSVIEWDDGARPLLFNTRVARDEQEQARYLREILSVFDRSAIDAAFVNTFSRYDLPHDDADDDRDFGKASFGIVKVLGGGRTGTTYPGLPWEPKAAFHALAVWMAAFTAREAQVEHRPGPRSGRAWRTRGGPARPSR
jgi:hypothetical protein